MTDLEILEIQKIRDKDYSSYQRFYEMTSQHLYATIWSCVENREIADKLLIDLYNEIYATISDELNDVTLFYEWADTRAQLLTTTFVGENSQKDNYDKEMVAGAALAGVSVDGAAVGAVETMAVVGETSTAGISAASGGATSAGISSVSASMGTIANVEGAVSTGTITNYGAGMAAATAAKTGLGLGTKIAIAIVSVVAATGIGIGISKVIKSSEDKNASSVFEESVSAGDNEDEGFLSGINDGSLHDPYVKNSTVIWDCVYFGNFYQNDTNGDGSADTDDDKEPIKWRVLSVDENNQTALLISDKGLSGRAFDKDSYKASWEKSSLREWLNDPFYRHAFSEEEKKAMLVSEVEYDVFVKNGHDEDGEIIYAMETATTNDKVRLLALSEIKKEYGFDSNNKETLFAQPTAFCEDSCGITNDDGRMGCYWWLLDSRSEGTSAAIVKYWGEVDYHGAPIDTSASAARPVILIDLNSDVWTYAGTVKE